MGVAHVIREYIQDRGIRQSSIAKKCGWTNQKTSAILLGKSRLAADDFLAICEALEVPCNYFYEKCGDKHAS